MGNKAFLVPKDHRVHLVLLVLQALMVPLVLLGQKGRKVMPAILAGLLGLLGRKAIPGHRGRQGPIVRCLAQPVRKVYKVRRVMLVRKGQKVILAMPAPKGR
jgi:hypothetical protein